MGKSRAPAAPDPVATSNAQTASNKETAVTQAQLNNVNQVDAYGNQLNYTSTPGANGVPQFTATQTLSPSQQALLNTGQSTQQNLANVAQQQSTRIGGLLNQPLDLSSDALDKYTNTHYADDFDKQQSKYLTSLETQLANQGIKPGGEAYRNSIADYSTNRDNAWDNFLGSQQSAATNALLTQRSTPLNEIIGLSSGSQIQNPQFTNTAQTPVAGTDVAGNINSNYQNQLNSYNNSQSDMLGGLFGLGAAGITKWSDETLKENVVKETELPDGTGVYSYNYKGNDARDIGVIAQEVKKTHPEAVRRDSQTHKLKVNYGLLMRGMR